MSVYCSIQDGAVLEFSSSPANVIYLLLARVNEKTLSLSFVLFSTVASGTQIRPRQRRLAEGSWIDEVFYGRHFYSNCFRAQQFNDLIRQFALFALRQRLGLSSNKSAEMEINRIGNLIPSNLITDFMILQVYTTCHNRIRISSLFTSPTLMTHDDISTNHSRWHLMACNDIVRFHIDLTCHLPSIDIVIICRISTSHSQSSMSHQFMSSVDTRCMNFHILWSMPSSTNRNLIKSHHTGPTTCVFLLPKMRGEINLKTAWNHRVPTLLPSPE